MNDERNNPADAQVPGGQEFLRAVRTFVSRCASNSDNYLSEHSFSAHQHLGTVLSLLDRASSCFWGCRGGDHIAESLVGRASSYAFGAFSLARDGFYDESALLIRTVGEIANLSFLFASDATALTDWSKADEKSRREKYKPVKVRLALEKSTRCVPIDQSRYGQLSAKAAHVTPAILPQMYNIERHGKTGGYFQEVGLLFCLTELGYPISIVAYCTVTLCGLDGGNAKRLVEAADGLKDSLPELRTRINVVFPNTYSSE